MKYRNLEELERHAAHETPAFMWYFLGKKPYQCQKEWGKRLDDEAILWEADFEPRDHGKCLPASASVWTKNGRRAISEISVGDELETLDDNLVLRWGRVVAKSAAGNDRIVSITTKTGKNIRVSTGHRLRLISGWVEADQLRIGQRIASQRSAKIMGRKYKKLPEGLPFILGLWLGDGYGLGITNTEPSVIAEVERCCELLGWKTKLYPGAISIGNDWKRGGFSTWLRNLGLLSYSSGKLVSGNAYTKFVPNIIFNSPDAQQIEFLSGYFAADGEIRGDFIGACSMSNRLTAGMQRLLLQQGIWSTLNISKKLPNIKGVYGRIGYASNISIYDYLARKKFSDRIKIPGYKQAQLDSMYYPETSSPRIDSIPNGWRDYRNPESLARRRFTPNYDRATSRKNVIAIAEQEDNNALRAIVSEDVLWDEIVSLELQGSEPVWDLQVEPYQTLIVDGALTHNSELFTLSFPLRLICLNPDIRILIVKNTKAAAIKAVSVIKTQLEKNERIKAFYAPHWLNKIGVEDISNADHGESDGQSTWGADKIYVKRNTISQDPTLEAVGVGGAITGGHYDVIILDDVEDPARMKTDMAYEDQIEWYTGTILQLREPWTKLVVVGTFKRASGDLYDLVRQNVLYSTTVQASIICPSLSEITYERVFDKDGRLVDVKNILPKSIEVLCPEKWPIKQLIMDREGALTPGMSDNTWRREKMNDLSAFKEGIFKRQWFQNRYKLSEIEDSTENGVTKQFFRAIVSGWDTAHTDKKTNSRAAFSVGESIGVGPRGYYLLPRFFRAQVEYPILKRAVVAMHIMVRPNVTIIENKDTGIALLQELRTPIIINGQNVHMPVLPFDPDTDKVARANATTPAWESGLIWLPEDCHLEHRHDDCVNAWLPGWIERHIDFPEATYKDDVDVTSMLINYLQRSWPMHGMKNEFKALTEDERSRGHSRVIDMRKSLGSAGRVTYTPKLASRVLQVPGRGTGRTLRQLPPGRTEGRDY